MIRQTIKHTNKMSEKAYLASKHLFIYMHLIKLMTKQHIQKVASALDVQKLKKNELHYTDLSIEDK